MKAIIVGNGPSILMEPMGEIIDSYDVVIRLKHCEQQLKDPEHFGTKIDVLAGSLTIAKSMKQIQAPAYWMLLDSRHDNDQAKRYMDDMVWYYDEDNMQYLPDTSKFWRDRYMSIRHVTPIPLHHPQMKSSRYGDHMGEKHPSQGFQALVYAAELLGCDITLVGCDNLYTGVFNWSITRGPDWQEYPFHRWDIEHDMVPMVAGQYDIDINYLLPDEAPDATH